MTFALAEAADLTEIAAVDYSPVMRPGELRRTFAEQGLVSIAEVELMIRMDYKSFADDCTPIAAGRAAR